MKNIELKSCYGNATQPRTIEFVVTPSTNATVASVFDGNGIDGYSVFLSPKDVLVVRDWFDERVRELIFKGQLTEHLGD